MKGRTIIHTGRTPTHAEGAALIYLHRAPTSAGDVGAYLRNHGYWKATGRRGVSSNGGGDYAAQMLLGRLRSAGWCRTQHGKGSSVWELTPSGVTWALYLERDE